MDYEAKRLERIRCQVRKIRQLNVHRMLNMWEWRPGRRRATPRWNASMFFETGPASPYSIGRRTLTAKAVDPTPTSVFTGCFEGNFGLPQAPRLYLAAT